MSTVFDPYHKWLGIPPAEQPANHYRLLGVSLFESDREVIELAADQRMAHLRSFQIGQNSEFSQRLLNEVAAAKLCLLNTDRRSKYDQTLRRVMAEPPAFCGAATIEAPPVTQPWPTPPIAIAPQVENLRLESESPPAVCGSPVRSNETGTASLPWERDAPSYSTRKVSATPARRSRRKQPYLWLVLMSPIFAVVFMMAAIAIYNQMDDEPVHDRGWMIPSAVNAPRDSMKAKSSPLKPPSTLIVSPQVVKPNDVRQPETNAFTDEQATGDKVGGRGLSAHDLGGADLIGNRDAEKPVVVTKLLPKHQSDANSQPSVPPILLTFDADDAKVEVPIRTAPDKAALELSLLDPRVVESKAMTKTYQRLLLFEQPEQVEAEFEVAQFKPGLAIVRIKSRVGTGTLAIPCNLNRLRQMRDALPGQVSDARSAAEALNEDISSTDTRLQNLLNENHGAPGVDPGGRLIQQNLISAVRERLRAMRARYSSMIRAANHKDAQLQELPAIITQVEPLVGIKVPFRIYCKVGGQEVTLATSSD